MTYVYPTSLYLSVTRASAAMSLYVNADSPRCSESFSLVLRAAQDTNAVLSTGQRLADVDIYFTLSTKWKTVQELDKDLGIDDVGFLSHNEGDRGVPFVHGAALLLSTTVVASLFHVGTHGSMKLVLPTVPLDARSDTPYVWGTNRENMLRVSHLELSALRGEPMDSESTRIL